MRGNDDRSGKRDRLDDGKLDVAGAGWKIENQIIELPPFYLPQKLLGVARNHRSAQNGRRSVVEQKSHRHETQSVLLNRNNLVFFRCRWALTRPEHERNARPVYVAITQTDTRTGLLKS